MNRRQSNKYNSYVSLKGILQANAGLYESIPVFKKNVDLFLNYFAELKTLSTEQAQDTTSVTDAKARAKDEMARLTSELSASAMAWAHENNDLITLGLFDYSYSDIRFARDVEAISVCMSVLQSVKENAVALADYMVSTEDIEALEGYIEEFSDLSETKGAVKSQSVSDTRKLAELFASIDLVLNSKLDKFMVRLQRNEPDFYLAYSNARNIVDL